METGVLGAGGGKSIWVVGDRYTIKCHGRETDGAFALIEATIPPGGGSPPHIHSREDEAFYLLEGQVDFHADGRTYPAAPGAWVTLPRGSLHHFKNTGPGPARMLIMVMPAGLEDYFLEVGREAREGEAERAPTPQDIEKLIEAAPRYGLELRIPAE
ncbi:Quercetin 2,3-dioxygenase [Aquisphaera giovannonii]|uniref:Quercetin 2,3-dioxygenase n=1 Tax=Aquisphaera giovannonii TaxID=406548 RepID=A0A5B9WBS3_9BACT|nr:cupin domain-containing protein [Aquisphaera giovannonii]QEH38128.1 Quercetin 2,3-dioxygenase [Aquisphaera giovannonii]